MGGHPEIRSACADEGLAILFSCPTARLRAVDKASPKLISNEEKHKLNISFHQRILDALAKESGYPELSTVPWLPIGESMSILLVNHLTQGVPERCIAGIWVKDGSWMNATESVPMLVACGTADEWDFPKRDAFERWREMAAADWKDCLARKAALPEWPASLLIEAGSAHFSVTDPMIHLIAQYIRAACKARLSSDGSPTLRPVDLKSGYVVGLPVPGATPLKPKPYAECTLNEKNLPWYFDRESAQAAYDMADVNWNAKSQIAAFCDPNGKPIPYATTGIANINPVMDADGITFTVKAAFLDKVPEGCVKAGASLTHASGEPAVEWLRGPVIPLGNNRFQLALDRSFEQAGIEQKAGSEQNSLPTNPSVWDRDMQAAREESPLLRTIHPGDADHRLCVCPAQVLIPLNKTGKPQTITFDPISDQHANTKEITLQASSSDGLPVHFFVKAGPAVVQGDRLIFKDVPQGGAATIPVTVAAWQWGNTSTQTAPLIEQTFRLGK